MVIIGACSATSPSGPSAEEAAVLVTQEFGTHWTDLKVTDCSGDATEQSCVVSYNRKADGSDWYEELKMDFTHTPSGWTAHHLKVLQRKHL
mgnify:CR=1 FL=1